MHEPTDADILQHHTAYGLFGEAVHDRRALKKAYAALIRRFDPDGHPAVFAHIRTLYEAARDGDTGAPDPDEGQVIAFPGRAVTTPVDDPQASASPSLAEQLNLLMQDAHAEEAIALLTDHDLELRIEAPASWFAAVAALADARTFLLPIDTLQSWLDGLDTPPEGVPDDLLDRIELLTSTGIAYQQARADPRIAAPLLDLIARWGAGPLELATAFMALGEALPDDEAAWDAFVALKHDYPGLWFPLTLMANAVTREVDTFDEAASPDLSEPAPPDLRRIYPGLPVRMANAVSNSAWATIGLAVLSFHGLMAYDYGVGAAAVAIVGVLLPIGALFVLHAAQRRVPPYPKVRAALVGHATREVRFPHEVLDRALQPGGGYPPAALLHWQRDPTCLMRVLTPAHLERIRARIARGAQTALESSP